MFQSREQAGGLLAKKLSDYRNKKNVVVLGIPRGGIVVARQIAKTLHLLLDTLVIRKIGAPNNPELAIGAIGPSQTLYWDRQLIKRLGVTRSQKKDLKEAKTKEQKTREILFRGRKKLNLRGKTVILVDDGIATGATVLCAFLTLRKKRAKERLLAVPVIAKDTLEALVARFDEILVLEVPEEFYAVGQFYEEFPQVSDDEVVALLASSSKSV